jgi:hypothetical protein
MISEIWERHQQKEGSLRVDMTYASWSIVPYLVMNLSKSCQRETVFLCQHGQYTCEIDKNEKDAI